MKKLTPRISTLAAALVFSAASTSLFAQTSATTDPVGYYKITLNGASDNYIALPMARDAVFAGTVGGAVSGTPPTQTFQVNAGSGSPGWTASQFVYNLASQRETYYVEFTSGALRGLFYKVTSNAANTLTVDTEGDNLTNHPMVGNPTAALAIGDGVKIRPYWRIKDVFENAGVRILEERPNAFTLKDDISIPDYTTTVGINKAASLTIYYVAGGVGWRAAGQGTTDFADYALKPNECMIVRRRNAANVDVTNTGWVLMNRGISFIAGGNGTTGNDTYISINRPAPVSLDASGLWNSDQTKSMIVTSPATFNINDILMTWSPGTGFNRAASLSYYYLGGTTPGWRQIGSTSTTIGQTVFLNPGQAYILRKKAANSGRDWINDPNY